MKTDWIGQNPNEILRRAILDNPRASEKETFDRFCAALATDSRALGDIVTYWFASHYRRLEIEASEHSAAVLRKPIRSMVERQAATKAEIAPLKNAIKALLSDFVLTSGKNILDSTFAECGRDGGWLLEVEKQGRPNEIVGRKLTEADLRRLWQRVHSPAKAA